MSDVAAIEQFVKKYNDLNGEVAKVIIGQDEVVNQILIGSRVVPRIIFSNYIDKTTH